MARSWSDIWPQARTTARPMQDVTKNVPTGRFQPSRGMFGFSRLPEYRRETTQEPTAYTQAEVVSDIIKGFNKQPVTYTTGPNGEIIATRSMARPEAPGGLGPLSPNVSRIFAPPNQNVPTGRYQQSSRGMFGSPIPEYENVPGAGSPLTASWVLPKQEGPRIFNRMIPASDEARSRFASSGYRGTPTAALNPSRLLSEDYLRVPLREGTSGFNEPIFGAVTDYPSQRVFAPNIGGTYGQEYAQDIGRGFASPGYDSSPALQALKNIYTRFKMAPAQIRRF